MMVAAVPADSFDLASLFDAAGPISARLAGYEPRPGQLEMARAVLEALEGGRHLAVEAGTGVGKSLGYLVPAAAWAAREGKKVVVATATRALQEQLVLKDLPAAAAALESAGLRFRHALLMGSENYLCLDRLARAMREPGLDESADWDGLWGWAQSAPSGLRTRLPDPLSEREFERVRREADLCPGRAGPFWDRCLYRKDVARAREAHVLVVNQHLLFAGMPVAEHDALIVDEAHNLEETASRHLGFELSDRSLARLLDRIQGARGLLSRLPPDARAGVERAARGVRSAARAFFAAVVERLDLRPGPEETAARRLRESLEAPGELPAALAGLAASLRSSAASLEAELEATAYAERCLSAAEGVRAFAAAEGSAWAYWAEARRGGRRPSVSVRRAPVEAAAALRQSLFGTGRPVVCASATLAVGGSFGHFKERVGLDAPLELKVGSPFDYRRQAALYLADAMPDPKSEPEAFERAVIERCGAIAPLVRGGVFLLFTSRQLLHRAHAELAPGLGRLGRPVFRQGERPPYELLERFRRAGDGVLFGTDTFWQGVDVIGPALSCVVISRLPFLAPDSPLEEARHESLAARGEDAFGAYTLPKAVLKLRQGFGRLIRSKADRGVVAVLDPRIRTRPYGKVFRKSLPDAPVLETLEELAQFLSSPKPS